VSPRIYEDDGLEDFTSRVLEFDGIVRTVYTCGGGPAVVVMPEMPGISPQVARFAGDRFCTAARFAAYQGALGDRFVARVLPDDAANPDTTPFFREVIASPHSVVTAHLIDEAGSPTLTARDQILTFLTERLTPDASP
jgi:hypothetical protein